MARHLTAVAQTDRQTRPSAWAQLGRTLRHITIDETHPPTNQPGSYPYPWGWVLSRFALIVACSTVYFTILAVVYLAIT